MAEKQEPTITELPKSALLSCIEYNITVHEGLIIFEREPGIWGTHARIIFERPEMSGGGCWYVRTDSSSGSVMVTHIIQAYEMVIKVYGAAFQEKKPL